MFGAKFPKMVNLCQSDLMDSYLIAYGFNFSIEDGVVGDGVVETIRL